MTAPAGTITSLLDRARSGDRVASEELFVRVFDELRIIAQKHLDGRRGRGMLQATGLVNAACARLLRREKLDAENRQHFFFVMGRAMHDVLVEHARAQAAKKRGGGRSPSSLTEFEVVDERVRVDVLELDRALRALAEVDADSANVVMLMFFAGLTIAEAGKVMGCTFAVARKHWDYAKAWLHERLSETRPGARIATIS